MIQATGFDGVTIDELRGIGGVKWTAYPGTIGAFVAEMDFGTAPAITQALHSAVDVGSFGYLPTAMATRMSEAYAEWSRTRYGWEVPAERVRPLPDVLAGLEAAIRHFSTPGSAVILPTPAYMPFVSMPPALGREVIEVPMAIEGGRYVYDLEALEAAFRAGGNLLILCNPHNPVGRVLERAEMLAISEVVERHGGRVFSDEIHAPLVYSEHQHVPYASVSEAAAGHTITATSASKAWNLPGMKCAQLVLSNDADAAVWAKVGMMAEHGAANLGVVANTAAYTAGGQWLDEVLGYLDANRKALGVLLAEQIPEIRYAAPEGTYLAWLDCRELDLGAPPAQFFLTEAGVAMTDGAMCGQAGVGFSRFNVATPRPILERAVTQMAEALARR
ncbi:MalY/PatB family protein [Georgenia faecalis]|uniref:MalY/PatB family protein n=1 Tax=Georgenia faecalis TaxID=2483799 RepID=UPI000FDC2D12|nr:MalY/PatB family protein [Georgenia faecalis]